MATLAKETHSFGAEVGKILQLMIHSLYEQKDIFLRELISNASDACDKLRYEAITHPEWMGKDELKITVTLDKNNRIITVSDNGIGMTRQEMVDNLGTIARSGTQRFTERLTGNAKKDTQLIGQFGVGFYSSYMVADKVEVTSRHASEKEAYLWESDGAGEFTVRAAEREQPRGTSVALHIRKEADDFLEKFRLTHIIKTYSDHIAFPIEFVDMEAGVKPEVINKASALWMKPKSEVTPEQYKEFYKHVGHAPDEPWMILHNKAEGTIEYTNLLFIPSKRPFDLFHPDRSRRVKLYVRRVFICEEEADVIPPYLRFLRGVVDSEDLPLNISRETLQKNATVHKIRNSIVSRVLSELKKKAAEDTKSYAEFWANFGPVIKEGLCEQMENNQEKILEVCRFYSTAGDAITSLDEYISRMKPEQKSIYYILSDDAATARQSPQIEGFISRGIEVLLLTDSVDDFWVNVVGQYKGKDMISATRAGVEEELEAISTAGDSAEQKEEKAEEKKKSSEAKEEENDLVAVFKQALGAEVQDVRVSHKLTTSPACLVAPEGMMDIRLERFLVENKQIAAPSAKILEINPKHPILKAMKKDVGKKDAEEKLKDAAQVLFAQACILEGEAVRDVIGFSRRVSRLLEYYFAA
jgi:molecular chaperone HtpG